MNLAAKAKVILNAAVTYIVSAGLVLAILIEELGDFTDAPVIAWVVRIAGLLVTILGVTVAIIRRVTPVLPDERGVLPTNPPGVPYGD